MLLHLPSSCPCSCSSHLESPKTVLHHCILHQLSLFPHHPTHQSTSIFQCSNPAKNHMGNFHSTKQSTLFASKSQSCTKDLPHETCARTTLSWFFNCEICTIQRYEASLTVPSFVEPMEQSQKHKSQYM